MGGRASGIGRTSSSGRVAATSAPGSLVDPLRQPYPAARRPRAPTAPRTRALAHVLRADEVSVAIPAYNHDRFVAAALESVRAQSLPPGQVVAVDDGSSDRTPEMLEAFELGGLSAVRQPNRGAHAALNRAISMCRGSWIAILNSDDLFAPERIEHALGVARSEKAALLLGRVRLIGESGAPLPADHPTATWYQAALDARGRAPTLCDALTEHNFAVTTSNFFFHRKLWSRLGGFRPYRYVHDLDFLLRALDLCPDAVLFEEAIEDVSYRVHPGNTISEDVGRALHERSRLLRARSAAWRSAARAAARAVVPRVLGWRSGRQRMEDAVAATTLPPRSPRARGGGGTPLRCGLVVSELDEGGLEAVVARLALFLPAAGIKPFVLCTAGGGRIAKQLAAAGAPVRVARGKPAEWRRWVETVRPDVLSTHFVPLSFFEEMAPLGVPAVETVHNTYAWFTPGDWREEAAKRELLRGTVAVSRIAGEYYARHVPGGIPPLAVIPNGIEPSRVCVVPKSYARRSLGIAAEDCVFVQVGRMTVQKNQAGLVSAFREVLLREPHALLLFVGSGSDRRHALELRARDADLLAAGRLRILPFDGRVDLVLSAADVYVANSWFEGWSVAATEALAAGLPLVLSDCGGSRELVGSGDERGRLVPNPTGDPLAVSPEVLANPDPAALARNREELVRGLLEMAKVGPGSDGPRAERRAHARGALSLAEMVRAYARVLGGVALGMRVTPVGAMDSQGATGTYSQG
ncbi:MAG: glycosyltransferase [Gemmatimonadetes bacterium]|nr:glycosyltransferase [Gemmatimonadota bacterium]